MSALYDLADEHVEGAAALDPLAATMRGVAGHDHAMTDLSPDGLAARAELDRGALARLATMPVE
ncbi:MAG: DUF885 domain-containing protein, partial [Actinomycetota bacterium]|nr:DUF885 domain-containing protein [Actinomycetota bacterium]